MFYRYMLSLLRRLFYKIHRPHFEKLQFNLDALTENLDILKMHLKNVENQFHLIKERNDKEMAVIQECILNLHHEIAFTKEVINKEN